MLRSIIDNSPAVVYVKHLDGRYLLVNRRFEEIFQLSQDAILGRTDYDLFAKKAADAFRSMDTSVAAAGTPLMQEETVPHVDGLHTYLSIKAPLNDSAGKICGVCGISTDITERKHAQERLRVQAERLVLLGLCALVIAPLIAENRVFGVMIVARRTPKSFASADREFLRQLSEHLALAAHQAQLYAALQRAYEDLRQTQQHVMQQERLRALGQMASGIAHDINNVLSPAALYIQSICERNMSLDATTRQQLVIVERAIEDVAATVGRMREFYRRGELQDVRELVALNQLIEHVIALTKARWSDMPKERGVVIEVSAELAPELPDIMGSGSELRDALTNLVLNAVDAMPQGGTLTFYSRPIAPAQVRIDVVDTGVGMDEQTRQRCLEPFFTTKGERGTGLGLAMVYGMIERHKGEIEIDSTPGVGTRISLTFPAAGPEENAATGHYHALPPSRPQRVLLIDDDPLILKSLRDVLTLEGHVVTVADGGQQGINAFLAAEASSEPFTVVITDLGMPHIDGRRVAAAVKSARPTVLMLLLTGWGHNLQAQGILEHVDRVLAKPPKVSELRAALADLGEHRE